MLIKATYPMWTIMSKAVLGVIEDAESISEMFRVINGSFNEEVATL